jgi:lysophospholipase L1-like esterase
MSFSAIRAEDHLTIATMEEPWFQPPQDGGGIELVEGKRGKAKMFRFLKEGAGSFFTSNIHGIPAWDRAAGFSFWVKGDGTDQLGGIEFIYDEDYAVRYDVAFPIQGTDWTKVTIAWTDFVPVLPGPKAKPLGTPGGNPPSKLSGLWFGKWWYWRDYPKQTFSVDEIRLEPSIERDTKRYRPEGPPLRRVLEKLKAGQPITIVTMGDSLTDDRHWANREVSWTKILKERLHAKYHADVTLENPAIGGTQLRQNLVLMPRWLGRVPEPDLVTIFFGNNDWDAGMRREEFVRTCTDAIDRVRRATGGKADVLLLTTNPTADRWDTLSELAVACREAALACNAGLADTAAAFHTAGQSDPAKLFVHDRAHLSPAGHAVVTETVLKAIDLGGKPER